ncbi:MAG: thioether cross-link-forming SCIFF peptide maturase [Clostridia bacterium]|nr:thioether cross-link-forming SCIFF peptide maturase [Clostridia bacterium]
MIHQYKLNGYNIVIDTASGAVHSVDDVAYDAISMFENNSRDEITKALLQKYSDKPDVTSEEINDLLDDIQTLSDEKKLFTKDIYEGQAFNLKMRNPVVKALCLHVSHACNLNCEYCFAAQGKYHGKSALMSFEVGKKALDFLVAASGTRTNLEVDFFGGEPLMNFDVVKRLVEYARSIEKEHGKNFRFTLTTNGVLIDDDVIDFCNRECHNVVLSLDGRKEIHDSKRPTPSGGGSYDLILPKFKKLVEARNGKGYYMRGTFTHANTDFTNDIFHMADLGFTELSMEPVVCKPGEPYALTENDLPVLLEQYEILAKEMIKRRKAGNGFTFYHYMIDLKAGPCIYKRISGCGSGTEYMAVTPSGDLYPCHQFVGDKNYLMGNVFEGVTNENIRSQFAACNVYSREECKNCWARLYCSGGCAANSYHATGSINGVYKYGCELFKKRMECAIMMEVAKEDE